MSITPNFLVLCNTLVVLLSVHSVFADSFMLKVQYDVSVANGFSVGVLIHEWPPQSDYVRHDIGSDATLRLDRHEAGTYFFTAQWVIYDHDGAIAQYPDGSLAISDESELVQYEIADAPVYDIPAVDDPDGSNPFSQSPDAVAPPTSDESSTSNESSYSGLGVPVFPQGCFIGSLFPEGTF